MQLLHPTRPSRLTSLRPALLLALCAPALHAADGTWIRTNASNTPWSLAGNWQDNTIADGAGSTATFNAINTGGTREVALDATDRTLGTLAITYNRATSGTLAFTFSGTTGGSLIFNNNGSAAALTLTLGSNVTTHSTNITAGVQLVDSLVVTNNATGALTLSGIVSGNGGLSNSGTGTLILSGANTYSGGTTLNSGVTSISADGNLGATTGAVTFAGGTLVNSASILTDAARGAVFSTGGGTLKTDAFLNWNGIVSGSGLLTKTGSSTLSLNNANNTHSGGIQINEGIFRFRSGDGSLGAAGNSVTLASGTTLLTQDTMTAGSGRTLTLTSGTVNFDIRNPLDWQGVVAGDGALNKIGAGTLTLSGANTYAGGTTLNVGTIIITSDGNLGATTGAVTFTGGTLEIDAAIATDAARGAVFSTGGGTLKTDAFLNWNGIVSGSGLLTKTGTNTLSLNNDANTHSGNIDVQAGTFRIRSGDGSLGAAGNSVTLASGTTFRVANFGSTSVVELAAGRTFTLTSGNVNFTTDTNNPMSSLITGAGGLIKLGAANLELKAANTYSGGTNVNEGTLLVNNTTGSATGSGTVTINSGATLGGSGAISGATFIAAGAFLNPGNSPGLLTFNNTLNLEGTATFEISGPDRGVGYDAINVGGLLTYGGALVLDFDGIALGDHTFDLFQINGGQTGDFTSVSVTGVYGSGSLILDAGVWSSVNDSASITFNQSTGDLFVSIIPEPSTYASLAGLGALAWSVLGRRRRNA